MGSAGISVFIEPELGTPDMTTRGGAGDVLSDTGDRRGVVGNPFPPCGPKLDVSERGEGDGLERVTGELGVGDEGPGDDELGTGGCGLDVIG